MRLRACIRIRIRIHVRVPAILRAAGRESFRTA